MNAYVEPVYEPASLEAVVSDSTLEAVLAPYKQHCRYLQSATVEKSLEGASRVTARGKFAISESCYIADTGHFNAVEFNICYNQLAYCLLAQCIDLQLLDSLRKWSIDAFSRRQLSDFLIVQFSSKFRKPLNARWFDGQVDIDKVTVLKGSIFMKTSCSFEDSLGATASGGALIVILGNGQQHERTQ
jgi:FcoT-like thioesterase domain